MKKTFILTLMLAVSGMSIFASPATGENPQAESAFKKQFAGAANVKWETVEGGFLQASFTWADHRTIAYFSPEAEFLGSVRNLFFSQLPLAVMRTIDREYGSQSVIEIREIMNSEGTHYSVVLDQKDKRYKLKVNAAGDITEKEKVKK
jgi:hypothetical protein